MGFLKSKELPQVTFNMTPSKKRKIPKKKTPASRKTLPKTDKMKMSPQPRRKTP